MATRRNSSWLIFLSLGLLVQCVTYWLAPVGWLSLVSGCLGICSVVLCSEGRWWTFVFGFGQILTYTYLCWEQQLYAAIAMNAFYFASQIYGLYLWRTRLRTLGESEQTGGILTRRLSLRTGVVVVGGVLLLSGIVGWLLARYTSDTQPYLDALTTVPALAAQVLMILAYREQWGLWLLIDVLSVAMWAQAGDGCMMVQYLFWCANCLYGYRRWTQSLLD